MKKIWKYLSFCLPVMALAVGCTEADGISEFQPDTNKTGDVTILASIENADSRASLVATGEARWQPEDGIKVVCDDGSTTIFELDGTGETRRALFKGSLSGNSVGEYAIYPTTADFSNNNLSITLPSVVEASATGTCAFMAGVIDEKNEVEFKQLTAYAAVQLNNIPDKSVKIVFSSDKNLSGDVTVTLPDALTEGAAAKAGDNTVAVNFEGKAPTMINVFLPLPVGEYSHITATAYNEKGNVLSEGVVASLVSASRGLLLSYNIDMPGASKPTPIPGTVNVAGIYWALGNLEYEAGATATTGFAEGWRIAPSQEHHFYMDKPGDIKDLKDYNKVAHFNFGGIADYASINAASAVHIAGSPAFDFSGKMYSDAACRNETTDFNAAQFGDIAHWASRGQFRMPTSEEFAALYEKACYTAAVYNSVNGTYFFDPENGEDPVYVEGVKELTAADLTVGLFLPATGRCYNNTEYNVYKVNDQGFYRASTVDPNSQVGNGYGVLYRTLTGGDNAYDEATTGKPFFNDGLRGSGNNAGTYNYGALSRYSIRPVYVSGNFAPVTPAPDPTPEPDPTPGPDTDPVPTTGTVTVAGIEWAIGNLQFEEGGATGEGFATGWSISAGQHFHFHMGKSGNQTDLPENFSKMAHFNFGGITNPFINDVTLSASIAGTKDISGKMYTDQTCVAETTDFAAAKFGDIAYWASKGAYRMPTADEMQKLYTDACRVKATYTTADGVEISGTYFYDPASGETPGAVEADAPRVVKNADMKKGLFLPYTGRGQSGNTYAIYAVNTQGVYRSSTTISASTLEQTFGAIYRPHILSEADGKHPTDYIYTYWEAKNQTAYGVLGRYAIRPVKVK